MLMKGVLICQVRREWVAVLMNSGPLVTFPLLGKCLLEYWLESLVLRGVKSVQVLVSDRPDRVRDIVDDGARWGLQAVVTGESRELTPEEARQKYSDADNPLTDADPVKVLDHFPGSSLPLFDSYAGFFAALMEWMPHAATPDRIGMREVERGVWVGLHSHLSPK